MTKTYIVYTLLFVLLTANCSKNPSNHELQVDVNDQVLNMNTLFDLSKVEAAKELRLFSSPFELRAQITVRREYNSGDWRANLTPCVELSRSSRLEKEFNNLSEEERREWFQESQALGKFGWEIRGVFFQNIFVSEIINNEHNGDYFEGAYIIIDNVAELDVPENECASFVVEHVEESFEQGFAEGQIGQVLIIGLKEKI